MPKLPTRITAPTESTIQSEIRRVVGALPYVRLWRNNTGQIKDSRGVPVTFGLCKGSSDLIGIVAPHGRLLAIECKSPDGQVRPEQVMFIELVRKFGGVAGVARSVDEALELVKEARTMQTKQGDSQ